MSDLTNKPEVVLVNGESVMVKYTDSNGVAHDVLISADPSRHADGLTIDLPEDVDSDVGHDDPPSTIYT